MGQKHSQKYTLNGPTASADQQRQSAQIENEVAFSTDSPARAPDEPVGVGVKMPAENNDYIRNAAAGMAKNWTDSAVAQSGGGEKANEANEVAVDANIEPQQNAVEAEEKPAPVETQNPKPVQEVCPSPLAAEIESEAAAAIQQQKSEHQVEAFANTEVVKEAHQQPTQTAPEEVQQVQTVTVEMPPEEPTVEEQVEAPEVGEVPEQVPTQNAPESAAVNVEVNEEQFYNDSPPVAIEPIPSAVETAENPQEPVEVPSEVPVPMDPVVPESVPEDAKENVPVPTETPVVQEQSGLADEQEPEKAAVEVPKESVPMENTSETQDDASLGQCQLANGEAVCCVGGAGKPSEL